MTVGLMLPLAFSYGLSRNLTTSSPVTTIAVTVPIIVAWTSHGSRGSA